MSFPGKFRQTVTPQTSLAPHKASHRFDDLVFVLACRGVFGNELVVQRFELGGILAGEKAHARIAAVFQGWMKSRRRRCDGSRAPFGSFSRVIDWTLGTSSLA